MKGFFFLLGGIGELMYPLFHKAAATVGGWIVSGLASMWSGFKGADGMVSPDPSSQFVGKSPTQIQDLCIFTFGEGQGC